MAKQWQKSNFGSRRVTSGEAPAAPRASSNETHFRGRVAIDVWEPTAESDGITYQVELADQAPDFGRSEALIAQVVERLNARLSRSHRP